MSPTQNCKALVISCIDFRFVSNRRDFLTNVGIKDNYDLITTPGASLNIGKIKDSIEISFKLHKPYEVYLFDHLDCGAYGKDNSEERHLKNLKSAKEEIQLMNSKADVKTFIVEFNGVKEVN